MNNEREVVRKAYLAAYAKSIEAVVNQAGCDGFEVVIWGANGEGALEIKDLRVKDSSMIIEGVVG